MKLKFSFIFLSILFSKTEFNTFLLIIRRKEELAARAKRLIVEIQIAKVSKCPKRSLETLQAQFAACGGRRASPVKHSITSVHSNRYPYADTNSTPTASSKSHVTCKKIATQYAN